MSIVIDDAPGAGATPDEWDIWQQIVGVARMLPIAYPKKSPSFYDPGAPIAEPHGLPAWQKQDSTAEELAFWRLDPRNGIGVRCGPSLGEPDSPCLISIDSDTDESERRDAVMTIVREELPHGFPLRYRDNSTRFMVFLWTDRVYRKRTVLMGTFEHKIQKVEFLAEGQQTVVAGTHDSGARIQWRWQPIPTVPAEVVDRIYDRIAALPGASKGKDRNVDAVEVGDRTHAGAGADPVTRWLQQSGRVLGAKPEGLYVECPWKDQHSKDSGITEAIWFYPTAGYPGGQFHCQHEGCASRGRDAYLVEVGYVAFPEVTPDNVIPMPPRPVAAVEAPMLLPVLEAYDRNDAGRVKVHALNLSIALEDQERLGYRFRHDAFTDRNEVSRRGAPWVPVDDVSLTGLAVDLVRAGFIKEPNKALIYDMVMQACRRAPFNSVADWLFGLAWDGVPRLDSWLAPLLGIGQTAYTSLVGRELIRAIVMRALSVATPERMPAWPYVVTIVGVQGVGKSTLARELAAIPSWFVEIDLGQPDRELAQTMQGALVAEIGELTGLDKRERGRLKHFIARVTERHRLAYDRLPSSLTRCAVMIGTTNDDEPLAADDGGQRRWLPLRMACRLDVAAFRAVREQLYAEAMMLLGEPIAYAELERLGAPEAAASEDIDPWVEGLMAFIEAHPERDRFTSGELLDVVMAPKNSGTARRLKRAACQIPYLTYGRDMSCRYYRKLW